MGSASVRIKRLSFRVPARACHESVEGNPGRACVDLSSAAQMRAFTDSWDWSEKAYVEVWEQWSNQTIVDFV
jgi:hypothetical protein